MLSLLIQLIVVGLICYLVYWGLSKIPLPEPFQVVIKVVLALAIVVYLVGVVQKIPSIV